MAEQPADRDELDALAEDFLARQRRGESPSVEQYASGHPELAEEIRELFPAMEAMERLKARGERTSGGQASLGPVKLDRLGDFRIIREIGRGGMGIVFEAEQESLSRRVALKVLPRQALLERRHLARFKREARLASRLHHTNIVQVYGVGEQDGFHYYVMQYVRGVGLDKLVERLGRGLGQNGDGQVHETPAAETMGPIGRIGPMTGQVHETPGAKAGAAAGDSLLEQVWSSLTGQAGGDAGHSPLGDAQYYRRVAGVGVQAAEALAYAHEQGTLHRDVKPANVLVDDRGVVWVTDFGLARAANGPDVTQPGDLTGTLRYLPPERLRGQVDARGDVYGLGLTLYELITGRAGHDESDRSALIRAISETSPPAPRRINPAVPRDLETIVLKAVAREPDGRYASAGALADDLRRFIEDRPIFARRVGPAERLWRWCRRNRAVAALSAATMMLVVAVALVASVGYVRTRAALMGESEQRRRAEAVADLAREAIDRVFERLGSLRPDGSASLSLGDANGTSVEIPRPAVASKESAALMEEMLPFYDRLARQTGDGDEALRSRAADAKRRIGDIRQRLGQYDQASAAYASAIEMYRQQAASGGTGAQRLLLAAAGTYNELGRTCRLQRKLDEAEQAHRQVLGLLGEGGGSASPAGRFEQAKAYYYLGSRVVADPGTNPPVPGGPGGRGALGERGGPGPREALGGAGGPGPRGGLGGPRSNPPDGPAGQPGRLEPGTPGPAQPDGPGDGKARPPRRGKGPGRLGPLTNGGPDGDLPGDRPAWRRQGPQGDGPAGRAATADDDPGRQQRRENLAKAAAILDRLVSEAPANCEYRHLLALCYREGRRGRGPDAASQPVGPESPGETGVDRAIEILESLVKQHPEVPQYRFDLSETYAMIEGLGPAGRAVGPPAVEQRLRKAMELSRRLTSEHPGVPEYRLAQAHINHKLAQVLRMTRRLDQAEQADRQAVEAQAALAGEFPEVATYRVWLAAFRNALADTLLLRPAGKQSADEAKALAESNIADMKRLLAEQPGMWYLHTLLADANLALASALRRTGQDALADQAEQEAQKHRRQLRPPGPRQAQ
jgi:serine/threonine protein kinase